MTFGLTPRQREVLDFIEGFIAANRCSPSFDEIREAAGLATKSAVHRLVACLIERGAITMLPNRARSIQIVREAA